MSQNRPASNPRRRIVRSALLSAAVACAWSWAPGSVFAQTWLPTEPVYDINNLPLPYDWDTAANWSGAIVPDTPGAVAYINNDIKADITIRVRDPNPSGGGNADDHIDVNAIHLGDAEPAGSSNFTLADVAGQTLRLHSPGAGIFVSNGSGPGNVISTPIVLAAPATIAHTTGVGQGYSIFENNTIGSLTVSGSIDNGGHLLTVGGTGALTTISGIISGSGGLTKADAGTVRLTAANTFTGPVTVAGGVLVFNSIASVGGPANSLGQPAPADSQISVAGGAVLQYNGFATATTDRVLSFGDGGILTASAAGSLVLTSAVIAPGAFHKYQGSLVLQAPDNFGGTVHLGFNSGRLIDGGTTTLSGNGTIAATSTVNLLAATLTLDNSSTYVADRIASTIHVNGTSTIGLVGGSETFPAVNVHAGRLLLAPSGSTPTPASMTIDNLTRDAGTVIHFGALPSGGAITVAPAGSPLSTQTHGIHEVWALANVTPTGTATADWTVYNPVTGAVTAYTGYQPANSGYRPGENQAFDAASAPLLASNTTIHSLKLTTTAATGTRFLGDYDLTVQSGGVIRTGSASSLGLNSAGGRLIAPTTLYLHNVNTNLMAVSAQIDAPAGLVYSGTNSLVLWNAANSIGSIRTAGIGALDIRYLGNQTLSGLSNSGLGASLNLRPQYWREYSLGPGNDLSSTQVRIQQGTLRVAADSDFGPPPAVPFADHIVLGDRLATSVAALRIVNDVTLAPTRTLNVNSVTAGVFSLNVDSGKTLTFGGTILQASTGPWQKDGLGTFDFQGTNLGGESAGILVNAGLLRFSGPATALSTDSLHIAAGGTLELDNTATAVANRINGRLVMRGGTFRLNGGSETTGKVSLVQGGSTLQAVAGGQLVLGPAGTTSLTRGTGTVHFATSGGGNIRLGATPTLAAGILGAYATIGGDWATVDGSNNVVAYSAYAAFDPAGSNSATDNALHTATSAAALSAPASVNSLKISNTSLSAQSLDLAGNAMDLGTGGLLVTGPDAMVISDSVGTGTLGTPGSEVIIHVESDLTVNSTIGGGTGSLTKAGAGTLVLGGANTYTGPTRINAGTLKLGASERLADLSSVLVYGGTFDLNGFDETIAFLGVAGGHPTASVVAIGGSMLNLTSSGVALSLAGGSITGNGTIVLGGNVNATTSYGNPSTGLTDGPAVIAANLDLNGGVRTFTVDNGTAPIDLEISGNITGSGGLIKTSTSIAEFRSGTLRLSGNNSYTGPTTINRGAVVLAGGNAIPDTSAVTLASVNGVWLDLDGSSETIGSLAGGGIGGSSDAIWDRGVMLSGGRLSTGADNTSTAFNGLILDFTDGDYGGGGVTKTGTGVWTVGGGVSGNSGRSWRYAGDTVIADGVLRLAGPDVLPNTSRLVIHSPAAGAFDLNGHNEGVGSLSGTGSIALGAATLTVGFDQTSTSYSGQISGSGGLVKVGTGTLSLSGPSTFSGPVTICDGTLSVASIAAGASHLGTGTEINLGELAATPSAAYGTTAGTLEYSGPSASNPRNVNVSSGGGAVNITHPGGDLLVGTLTITAGGSLTKSGPGALTVAGTQSHGAGTTLHVTGGTVNLNSNAGTPATNAPSPAVANLTLNVTGGTALLGAPQDLLKITTTVAGGVNLAGQTLRIYTLADEAAINAAVAAGRVVDGSIGGNPWQIGITDEIPDAAGNPMILVQVTRKGDANLDGTTNFTDLLRLSQNYNQSGKLFDQADFTYDGTVNFNDLLILSQNYNQSYASAGAAAVPEPAAAGLLLLAGLALGRRRGRSERAEGSRA